MDIVKGVNGKSISFNYQNRKEDRKWFAEYVVVKASERSHRTMENDGRGSVNTVIPSIPDRRADRKPFI